MEDKVLIMTLKEWAEYNQRNGWNIDYETYLEYAQHVVDRIKI